ncbi:UDP-glucuronosyl/UDP-glucosyltransferase [Artemisia annua]|uniref:UDP-glucuronosyl/UDP-glucosyltransferase n=1 Tax=Artemisia annua TaxID=35608 RepID=A0A2U1MB63_ARTAN|nr:UDP-glucuronosyl/UDP-glucosyltransferase [Artemisia annua]
MANSVANLIFIPTPGVGHIMSTIEIAKILVNRDQNLSITVLIIKPPSLNSSSAITSYIESLAKNIINRISFIELPQSEILPQTGDSKLSILFFKEFIKSHCKYVKNIVADLISGSGSGSGRVAGFVVDMFCTCMIDVANEFNVPTYVFFTSNATYLGFTLYIQTLHDVQKQDVIELSHSNTEIQVPGFVKPVPTKVFPAVTNTQDGLEFLLWDARRLRDVKAIMVNTYFELETHAFESLSADKTVPSVYPVGPILNLENSATDDDLITWLDSQPPSSVVFLCFGSMGSFDEVQVKEIARGLEQSGYCFVWSLRRPPSDQASTAKSPSDYEDPSVVLPEGFLERTAEQGKVIGWAPQVTLLGHQAVGGFMSHCGWNSLLESLWFGVPSATWPIYAEQQMNAFDMVVELGLAVEITLDYKQDLFSASADWNNTVIVTAEEIESGIRRLMEDNEIRTKVKEMSAKSRAAVTEGRFILHGYW